MYKKSNTVNDKFYLFWMISCKNSATIEAGSAVIASEAHDLHVAPQVFCAGIGFHTEGMCKIYPPKKLQRNNCWILFPGRKLLDLFFWCWRLLV